MRSMCTPFSTSPVVNAHTVHPVPLAHLPLLLDVPPIERMQASASSPFACACPFGRAIEGESLDVVPQPLRTQLILPARAVVKSKMYSPRPGPRQRSRARVTRHQTATVYPQCRLTRRVAQEPACTSSSAGTAAAVTPSNPRSRIHSTRDKPPPPLSLFGKSTAPADGFRAELETEAELRRPPNKHPPAKQASSLPLPPSSDRDALRAPCPEPTCTRVLPAPRKCQSGANHGKWYTACFNEAHGHRYKFWDIGIVPNGLPPPAQPSTAPQPAARAPTTTAMSEHATTQVYAWVITWLALALFPSSRAPFASSCAPFASSFAPFACALHSALVAMEAFVRTFQVELTLPTLSETSSASSSVFCGTQALFRTWQIFVEPIFDEQPDPTPTSAPAFTSPALLVPAPTPHLFDFGVPARPRPLLTQLAEKMEVLAARLRRSNRNALPITDLQCALDALMLATENSNVLPTSTQVPCLSGWNNTRQAMMPGIKVKGSKRRRTSQGSPRRVPPVTALPAASMASTAPPTSAPPAASATPRVPPANAPPATSTAPPPAASTPPLTAPPTARPERRAATQPKVDLGAVLWR
ncbi:hypothetical protein GGX14DRAFT_641233 [Mycena pura]|uniref:Uncharacterized protein n=1 Tax=Mycena pura TaxID=153505 RepID=A0AAD7E323_9AGAR|nr:hypothetical protein GGX14DRAFT_641233 [Mycena pura]